MKFKKQIRTAVRAQLERAGEAGIFRAFIRDAVYRDAVCDAVWARFREDEPTGGLVALLNWIATHQEEILAIVKLVFTIIAMV